ncbi:MAG: tyrosine-type recombinase/integrase [Lachnospiraceae bacterium]|nr:tyrosine-type recombinase/integrase [Lachnospiraceae bacterium]
MNAKVKGLSNHKEFLKVISNPFVARGSITHILRYTACTRMEEQGMDQRTLQEIRGHQNLTLTMKGYNHVDDKHMRDEMGN